jgi:hypothetical protein
VLRGLIIEINIRLGVATPNLISNERNVNQGTSRKVWPTGYCFGHCHQKKTKNRSDWWFEECRILIVGRVTCLDSVLFCFSLLDLLWPPRFALAFSICFSLLVSLQSCGDRFFSVPPWRPYFLCRRRFMAETKQHQGSDGLPSNTTGDGQIPNLRGR